MGAIKKLQPTIIAIFDYVLLFHKFYVSNHFYPLLIKKCSKEVPQNPGNPGLLPLVTKYWGTANGSETNKLKTNADIYCPMRRYAISLT